MVNICIKLNYFFLFSIGSRLAAALAACAQLSALQASQRMWSLQSLRRLMMTTNYGLSLNIMSESQSSASGMDNNFDLLIDLAPFLGARCDTYYVASVTRNEFLK